MNRTKKFFKNSAATALFRLVAFFVGLITPRLILSAYGSEINGLLASINQFISYFRLVEAGLSSAVVYALYKPLAEENPKAINGVLTAAKLYHRKAGYFFLFLTLLLAIFYPQFVSLDSVSHSEVFLLVFLLAIDAATLYLFFFRYGVLLVADQRNYVIALTDTLQLLCYLLLVLITAAFKVNIVLFIMITLSPVLLRSFLQMFYCKKQYPFLKEKETPNLKALSKRWDACFHQILSAVNTGAPVILLTLCTGDLKLVSVYTIFNIVIAGLNGLLGIFHTVLLPTFGDLISRKEKETLKTAHQQFEFAFYGLISLVYSIAFVTIMPFIRIYTQDIIDNDYDLPLFAFLFLLSALFQMIALPQGMLVASAGHYRETRRQIACQSAISVAVSLILLPIYGIYGVMLGTLASSVYLCFAWFGYTPKHITGNPLFPSLCRAGRIFICIFLITTPFLFLSIEPLNFIQWIFYAALVGVYGVLVVYGVNFLCERGCMREIWGRVK